PAAIDVSGLGPTAGHAMRIHLAETVVGEGLVTAVRVIDPFNLMVSVAGEPGGLPEFICAVIKIVGIIGVSVTEPGGRIVTGMGRDSERADARLAAGGSDVVSCVLKRGDVTVAIIKEVRGLVLEVGVIGKLPIVVV